MKKKKKPQFFFGKGTFLFSTFCHQLVDVLNLNWIERKKSQSERQKTEKNNNRLMRRLRCTTLHSPGVLVVRAFHNKRSSPVTESSESNPWLFVSNSQTNNKFINQKKAKEQEAQELYPERKAKPQETLKGTTKFRTTDSDRNAAYKKQLEEETERWQKSQSSGVPLPNPQNALPNGYGMRRRVKLTEITGAPKRAAEDSKKLQDLFEEANLSFRL